MRDEEVLGKVYDRGLVARIVPFVRPHVKWLWLSLILIPVVAGAELLQPYLIKVAIDQHIAVGKSDGLGAVALGYLGLVALQTLLGYAQLYALQYAGQLATNDLRTGLHRHILTRKSSFFDRTPVGRLVTRVTGDVDNINEMFASGVITLLADAIKLLGIIGILLWMNWKLALLTFLVLPILVVVVEYFRRLMRSSFRQVRHKIAQLNAYLQEHVGGMKVVQLFAREEPVHRTFEKINADHRDANLSAIRADASLYATVEAIGSVTTALILWYAGGGIAEGAITFGLLVAFIEYINKFFVPVRDLSAKWGVMQSAMASAERIFNLYDEKEEDAPRSSDGPPGRDADGGRSAPAIELRDVTFSYNQGEPVLNGTDLQVKRGQTVAVVGATGSGKSTLVKLLLRLYEPQGGAVRLFGRDVRELDKHELRRKVTVVPQDVFLFAGTIRENLTLGLGDVSEEAIETAVRRVGLDKALRRRKEGLDSVIAERAANFSAGERQLLAFARALVRDPEVLVLDEATASVDPEAEAWIEEALAELMKGRTSLVIAHRLSTIRRADRIVVLQRGTIVEEGTHAELVELGGRYARLYQLSRTTQVAAAPAARN